MNRKHLWKDMSPMKILKSSGLYEEDWRTGKKCFSLAFVTIVNPPKLDEAEREDECNE